jgi:hypothetical protein
LFISSAMFLLAAMVQAIRHALSGDRQSRVMASGLVVLFAVLIDDMTSELKLLPRIEGMPVLGFILLFIVRSGELVARWGGEEFILRIADDGALERAEALQRTLAGQSIAVAENDLVVTVSIGLSPSASTGTLDERLTAADRALYRAKQQGRNCVVVAAA